MAVFEPCPIIGTSKRTLGALLEDPTPRERSGDVSPGVLATFYTGLGETGEALAWLARAYQERVANRVFLNVDPFFDGLRDNPEFQALSRRVGISAPGRGPANEWTSRGGRKPKDLFRRFDRAYNRGTTLQSKLQSKILPPESCPDSGGGGSRPGMIRSASLSSGDDATGG